MGPTCSGKTSLACQLSDVLEVEIVSVDSALIYKGMNIGTAKPDELTLSLYPHHLIDICAPSEAYSAARFVEDVRRLIQEISARGRLPLLVGGTMMYFRALQQGINQLPASTQASRVLLQKQLKEQGLSALYQALQKVDKVMADALHPNDTQRVMRALEVYQLAKKPMSELLAQPELADVETYINLALIPNDRQVLHKHIEQRFLEMLDKGFLDEAKALFEQGLDESMPAMRAVGYRQACQYFRGEIDYASFVEKSIVATRQLAKRQLTWLRSWSNLQSFPSESPNLLSEGLAYIKKSL